MSEHELPADSGVFREAIIVAALTVAGGILRLWSLGRLGLVHFDEGIYAIAGYWAFSPKGLGGLDPIIYYAPPGFPYLVGLAYSVFGASDISAIVVSIVAGTLTIPAVGWLAYRSFGPGAGAAASAFAALSGPHIAFSRMALTDVSFLLFWLVAIGMGQRFLERPGPGRAVALGLSVGVAQLFKYNGWIAGVLVALGAVAWTLFRGDERTARKQFAVWGWGLVAAMVAAVAYWPWFRFVESHDGYAALMAHHRAYMGGLSSWPRHALAQLGQDRALSGGVRWLAFAGFAGAFAMLASIGARVSRFPLGTRMLVESLGFAALCAYPHGGWFGAVFWIFIYAFFGTKLASKASCLLLVGLVVLALLTPFYRPYARLLLPVQALGWLLLAGAFTTIREHLEQRIVASEKAVAGLPEPLVRFVAGCWLVPIMLAVFMPARTDAWNVAALLEPSDSLRRACRTIAREVPDGVKSLRLFARPPVTFYLPATTSIYPQPTFDRLFEDADARTWALLDEAMVRQFGGGEERLTGSEGRWDLVREVPTTLNLPTLLDVDPSAAARADADRSAPLRLYRPKRPGAAR